MIEDFFEEQLPGSKFKSLIVSTYFRQWAKIIGKYANKIGYIDLFCGPGKYEDGSDSTPLLVLKSAIADEKLKKTLVTIFNDKEPKNIEKLREEIKQLDGISEMKFQPFLDTKSVGEDVVEEMKKVELIPSLIFLDPFGYKGLSLELLASVIKDWGCDCIFFFNYNRINAALTNPFMESHINSIFGEKVANELREKVVGLSPFKREQLILETFMNLLKSIKGQYSIRYKFYQEDGSKTSHFLILVTKNPLGYHLMKEIMAGNCSDIEGIPTFDYNPLRQNVSSQNTLFGDLLGPMSTFCDKLTEEYKGKTITVEDLYQAHNIGRPYIKSNYKTALLKLEEADKIIVEPPKDKRRVIKGKSTMGDLVKVTFK